MRLLRLGLGLCGVAAVALGARGSSAVPPDPTSRGIALYAHAAGSAVPGGKLSVALEAYGFPAVTQAVALGGATVELGWDPASLGPDAKSAPSTIATTDALGHAVVEVPVPDGDARELKLLLAVRKNEHTRTSELKVQRGQSRALSLYLADATVVPGGSILAWAWAASQGNGRGIANGRVAFRLLEGGVPRVERSVATDASGLARFEVPVPRVEETAWSWTVEASIEGAALASAQVALRNETPRTPSMAVKVEKQRVLAGESSPFAIFLRDASNRPLVGSRVTYVAGPSTQMVPEDEEEWAKVAKVATTDAEGRVRGTLQAPSLVAPGATAAVVVQARAMLEGREVRSSASLTVGRALEEVSVRPEANVLVPGVAQKLLLTVTGDDGEPVRSTSFEVAGDGLRAKVTTDAFGEATFAWSPPVDVGAARNVGPCAGGVAAQVTVRPEAGKEGRTMRTPLFETCVAVDRELGGLLEVSPLVAMPGDKVHVRVATAKRDAAPWSLVVETDGGRSRHALWLKDGEGDLVLDDQRTGVVHLSAVSPRARKETKAASGTLLVLPRVRPKLSAKLVSGRATPNGAAEIDVFLTDGAGRPLSGTVAAAMGDLHAGASLANIEGLDYRQAHCLTERARCDAFLEGGPEADSLRRFALGERRSAPLAPVLDPKSTADDLLRATFAETLRSLEGAVFQASSSREALRDVRRGDRGNFTFNPELLTLVTAAMSQAPQTPGGEPFALGDLMAVDRQVTFDNVARRVTRLKLFRAIAAVRAAVRGIDRDEAVFKNPPALLRKMLRDETLSEEDLIDPWGGTIQFTQSGAPPEPFLTIVRGFELRSPGPDGLVGTADDVRDPFGRVVRSGTPYANALSEDRIVDAKFEMEVADATIESWKALLEKETGMALGAGGRGEGIGLSGVGSSGGGTGQGFGSGHGRMSGSGHVARTQWLEPMRTDAKGHLRMRVPLGPQETTWRVGLLALGDDAPPVVELVDVPVSLPLSAFAELGETWTEGDAVSASITVRNRTAAPVRVALAFGVGGSVELGTRTPPREVLVPADGATDVQLPLRARSVGEARLTVSVKGGGNEDTLTHHWEVRKAAEPSEVAQGAAVAHDAELHFTAQRGVSLRGTPRLVLSRGYEGHLRAALSALDPDRQRTREGLADALEVTDRLGRWAAVRGDAWTTDKADDARRRAVARLASMHTTNATQGAWAADMRAREHAPPALASWVKGAAGCPPTWERGIDGLDAEPMTPPLPVKGARGGAAPATKSERLVTATHVACWDSWVTDRVASIQADNRPVPVARALLAFMDRPHRAAFVGPLVEQLRKLVKLQTDGGSVFRADAAPADRAVVYAALLRTVRVGASPAPAEAIAAQLVADRDVQGGYGSSTATRAVAVAIMESELTATASSHVVVESDGFRTTAIMPPSGETYVPLPPGATRVWVHVDGPAVIARFERPVYRAWATPPAGGGVLTDVRWPKSVEPGGVQTVEVDLRPSYDRPVRIEARIPLPPGVALAAPVEGVTQSSGVLSIVRDASDQTVVLQLPLRFRTAIDAMVPEGRVRLVGEEGSETILPARRIVVR